MNIISKKINRILLLIVLILVFFIGVGIISGFFSNKLKDAIIVEAGAEGLDVSEFIIDENDKGTFISDLSTINLSEPGIYEIKIKIGRRTYTSELEIRDTSSPTGEVINQEIWANEELAAKDFVENIVDATEVVLSFINQPDFSKAGMQEVILLLEDTSANKTELKASLTIKEDNESPEIEGVKDQIVYIGDSISYKRDVKVSDNRDKDLELMVDSSAVNLKKEGTYEVHYSAIDNSGNKATKVAKIEVRKKPKNYIDPEEVHKLADNVLNNIITEDMTDKEKLWAIFKWTNKHITYTGYSDKSDWLQGAALGIKKRSGDCFTYYATARELLSRAGYENICVTRIGGTHFWNLVYYDGGWYHFDTSPYRRGYPNVCFLHTDKQVADYSKVRKDYYNFDKSKYPETPLEPIEPIE